MNQPPVEVADIIRACGAGFLERSRRWLHWSHVKVLNAIARCRTAALGGHRDQCPQCGHQAIESAASEISFQPIHTLGSLVCFGHVSCSPPLMGLCAENGVSLAFFSENGRFQARVQGPISGNVLLRREQYRRSDNLEHAAGIARSMVIAKIANCRTVLLRATRDKPEYAGNSAIEGAACRLAQFARSLEGPRTLDAVRGHEGDAARVYFEVFDHLVTESKDAFFFRGRSRRPPL
jgi:CRISPR-associated endonuclease Cas1